MLQLLRYAFAYTFGVLGFLVVVAGPQLLPRILTKDWMGSVQKWIIIDFLNSHRFCHFQKKSAFCLIVLQCHSLSSCPNLIALDQSEFSSHNALFGNSFLTASCALIFNLLACRPPWYTCFKRLRILNLIGFAVHDITLLSRSPETEKVAVVCCWRLDSSNHFSLSWILTIQMQLNLDTASSIIKHDFWFEGVVLVVAIHHCSRKLSHVVIISLMAPEQEKSKLYFGPSRVQSRCLHTPEIYCCLAVFSHSPPVHGAFWLFVSSTIEFSCLHRSTLQMFMW